ncbi:olfactory receptor 11A1-like [Leuresthes tenuis]|uniref:olfactory receptor 11A1-like n=1 Tax=Leuresthes tenuis TaxID=355514 RepID=UPI003B5064BF
MLNDTTAAYFTLAAYFDTRGFRYLLFFVVMFLYVFIICANVVLIVVISVNRSLHEPMYLFLCSLFVNELYGSSGLFPFLLIQILSDLHTVSAPLCFLQVFCLYSYASVQLSNLSIMSYDRYLAICFPLQYNTLMTSGKTARLVFIMWFYPFLAIVVLVSMTAALQLCGNIINRVFCDNYSIVKLACSDFTVINIYGLIIMCILVIFPAVLIVYSYTRILKVCYCGSKQTRQKAVRTCTPHLASLLNFSFGCCFEILQSRFDLSSVPSVLRIVLSVYYLTCQPLFNPLLYGLNMSKIRTLCKSLLKTEGLASFLKLNQ